MKSSELDLIHRVRLGQASDVDELFSLAYDELRRLAASRMAQERADHTLQTTGLVHEAYVRLTHGESSFDSMPHFFAAAAEAMRRILVDHARKKASLKRGAEFKRVDLTGCEAAPSSAVTFEELLDLDESLERLESEDPAVARLVSLRVYAGLSVAEAAEAVGVSRSTGYQFWDYALAWFAAESRTSEASC